MDGTLSPVTANVRDGTVGPVRADPFLLVPLFPAISFHQLSYSVLPKDISFWIFAEGRFQHSQEI